MDDCVVSTRTGRSVNQTNNFIGNNEENFHKRRKNNGTRIRPVSLKIYNQLTV